MRVNISIVLAVTYLVVPWVGSAQSTTLLTTFTNPTPAAFDAFGWSVAAVGIDRVLVGAWRDDTGATDSGAAYLFSTNGTLLTTFINPAPAASDYFGYAVAGVGNDRVAIGAPFADAGAPDAGAAYLFSAGGILLTNFTNPNRKNGVWFGLSVAAVGDNRVVIGAPNTNTGGAAYLFSTNGALLTTFTNPMPATGANFGWSVAGVGSDQVLVGADGADAGGTDAGAAYLFSTNGALLKTFTNLAPAGAFFGRWVAGLGSDRMLVGADGGRAAYLLATNGMLLTTFTNPEPGSYFGFGVTLAAVGKDRLVIGSFGGSYLFSTNGMLLAPIANPDRFQDHDTFGYTVAAVGSDRVLIGAYGTSNYIGAAYLFSVSPPAAPVLTIRLTPTNTVAVSWPSPAANFTLQQATSGIATVNWSNVTDTIQDDGTNKILIINRPTGARFYRLFKPPF